jgi:hypothetical protein
VRRREVEAVPVRATDARPGLRAGHVHAAGHRVEEIGEAAAPGGVDSFRRPGRNDGHIDPLSHRGAEVTGLAAEVEQVKHVVGRR